MVALKNLVRCLLVGLLIGSAGGASAGMLHDPWLERFQVGEFRQLDQLVLQEGWPEGLLEPLTVDPGWLLGAGHFFRRAALPRRGELAAWRLALPALGSAEAAERAYGLARRQWRAIVQLDGGAPPAADPALISGGPWPAAVRQMEACRLWRDGRWPEALQRVEALLQDAEVLGLTESQVFVWSLRAMRLAAGRPSAADAGRQTRLWRSLLDLGLYDARGGWTVWTALQRDRGRPPLPATLADRDAAVMLATAGVLWLDRAELVAASLPADAEAGLGALLLPADDLPAHFARFRSPPADGRFQGYWLRGQRRLRSDPAAIEELASLPGLADGHRLDAWRRASEGHLLRGRWADGLRTLERGLRLLPGEASTAMQDRMRIWVVQALALALNRGRLEDAARIDGLARGALGGDQARAYEDDAAPLLAMMRGEPAAEPRSDDLRASREDRVLWGRAASVADGRALDLPSPEDWRHDLWAAWARWGLALLADGGAAEADDGAGAHRDALQAVLGALEPSQRHATAVAAAARLLRGAPVLDDLLSWAMIRDIEVLSGGVALPHQSPLPRAAAPSGLSERRQRLHDHALLGAALALGDDRGVIAMAVRLPSAGVAPVDRWAFWYPVPGDPAIRQALREATLPAELLLAIARNESLFEPAVRSRAGALGYMQIMPFHYDEPAGPPGPRHWRHPAASLRAGARILAEAVRRHQGDPYRSVAAYNAGSGAVERWERQLGPAATGLLYRAWISYPETRGYTLRVLRDREVYRALLDAGR